MNPRPAVLSKSVAPRSTWVERWRKKFPKPMPAYLLPEGVAPQPSWPARWSLQLAAASLVAMTVVLAGLAIMLAHS